MREMKMQKNAITEGWLHGKMLVAAPTMIDPRFEKTVVVLCVHHGDGAMGIIVNRMHPNLKYQDMMVQIGLPKNVLATSHPIIYAGGPVEGGRGFVLHSTDWGEHSTLDIDGELGMTATIDVLKEIAAGKGPKQSLLSRGYAGWAPGQLEAEIQANGWMVTEADPSIIFSPDLATKWHRALHGMGIRPDLLSGVVGHA
jgi:putative transcriptional regulator